MKINSIHIENVGGIEDLFLTLNPQMNILCGPNGIGKTTVLESIAHCFAAGQLLILKRHARAERGSIKASMEVDGSIMLAHIEFNEFRPDKFTHIHGLMQQSKFLISLKTSRTFTYSSINAISKDPEKQDHIIWEESKNGISLNDIKNWFINRFLYSAHPNSLSKEQLENYNLAIKCFSVLNSQFTFSKVEASTNEILINSPGGEIYYEYLSSGFKSSLSILFGIIKEIEYRFPQKKADEFDGVILVDEIELHLHPDWQSRIAGALIKIFPKAQFIVTTHSPHVIQSADSNQIVALEFHENKVVKREVSSAKYGFKGWTLDEVLTDIMGMPDTRTEIFNELMRKFSSALDEDNHPKASEIFKELDATLHPNNPIRKLLKIQIAAIAK